MWNYKSVLSSIGVWGGIIAVLGGVFGFTVSETDVAEGGAALASVIAGVGGLIAVIGRIRATKQVTLTGKPPSVA